MATRQITLEPLPGMQSDVIASPADEILCGGSAGTGKSFLLLYYDLPDLIKYPDLKVVIIRRNYVDLSDLIEKAKKMYEPFKAKFFPMNSTYKKPMFVFPKRDKDGKIIPGEGAKVFFGYLANYADTERFQGLEFSRVRFDELGQFAEKEYLYLFSRMRATYDSETGVALRTHILSTTNPTGQGFSWIKRRFIDKLMPGEIKLMGRDQTKGGKDCELPPGHPAGMYRQWLPGNRADNIHLDLVSYEARLSQLDPATYRALALGLWETTPKDKGLINPAWIDKALSGEVAWAKMSNDALGADVAHSGGDRAVILKGNGNRVLYIKSWQGLTDLNTFALRVQDAADEWDSPCYVAIDSNGIGAGPTDLLQFGGAVNIEGKQVTIQPRIWLERCLLKDDTYDAKYRGVMKFNSFKAQAYWKLREDFRLGRIDLSLLNSPDEDLNLTDDGAGGLFLTDVGLLTEELLSIEYEDDSGVFQITPKRKLRKADSLGRSPDFADALVYWNWIRERPIEAEVITEEDKYETWLEQLNESGHKVSIDAEPWII